MYDTRAEELKDADYEAAEINHCEVKDIQNTPKGVSGFWLRSMINHSMIGKKIQEKDKVILRHLQDI